jgi:hypothetical protein
MAFTAVEIIALVLLALAVVKMLVLLISAKSWMNLAKKLYGNKLVFQLVCLVLAAVVFYFLLQELTVIQIFAATAFVALLIGIGLADPIKRILPIYRKQIKEKTLLKSNWLYIILWLALMAWVFLELFFPSVI